MQDVVCVVKCSIRYFALLINTPVGNKCTIPGHIMEMMQFASQCTAMRQFNLLSLFASEAFFGVSISESLETEEYFFQEYP